MTSKHQSSLLRIAAIGLGGRGRTYLGLAAQRPDLYQVAGGADLDPQLVEQIAALSNNPDFRGFASDREILAEPRFADVMVISTQDAQHREHAIAAMEKGYDILLEKPVSTNMPDVIAVEKAARELNRRAMVCHVLRYSPLYTRIKEIVDSSRIGEIISINAVEGVGAFHQAHSYVRGHWARTEDSSPMIIAKSCHDLDIIHWLVGAACTSLSSYGGLKHFTSANAPEGAPERCHQGCPVNKICPYDSAHYATTQRKFSYVGAEIARPDVTPEEILQWIQPSPWGRCVYRCDNNAVDHQVVNMVFEGGVTAVFTMTAFAHGRGIEIYGTRGGIRAGVFCEANLDGEIVVLDVDRNKGEVIKVEKPTGGYESHGGADAGLVEALYDQMRNTEPGRMNTSISSSVMSHAMGFAAEQSRLSGETVHLADYLRQFDRECDQK